MECLYVEREQLREMQIEDDCYRETCFVRCDGRSLEFIIKEIVLY